jgi:hypothetical protein
MLSDRTYRRKGMKKGRSSVNIAYAQRFGLAVLAATFGVITASGNTLLVSESGVWSGSTPTTTWSAPDEPWSYSFLTSSTPSVSDVFLGSSFEGAFSDFTYMLNGTPVATNPIDITWFNSSAGGLIDVDFSDGSFGLQGGQAYSSPENAPTIIPGTYALSTSFFVSGATFEPLTGDLLITEVPEPATIGLLLLVSSLICGIGLLERA